MLPNPYNCFQCFVFFSFRGKHWHQTCLRFIYSSPNLLITISNLSSWTKTHWHDHVTPRQVWMIFSWMSTMRSTGMGGRGRAAFLTGVLSASCRPINSRAASPQLSPAHPWMTNELAFLKVHFSFRDNKNPGGLVCVLCVLLTVGTSPCCNSCGCMCSLTQPHT